jgi:hypothetical protein
MSEADLRVEIQRDLRKASSDTVIYLEGQTDPTIFFALLGLPDPPDGLYQGVLVRGLKGERRGSGSGLQAVTARIALASQFHGSKILGVIDGDGRSLGELVPAFDAPYLGPLFCWKAYCIENLLTKTGWPPAWGGEPDWTDELTRYGPYAALNRVVREAGAVLKDLGLVRHSSPDHHLILKSSGDIAADLAIGKGRLMSFDVEQQFIEELSSVETAIRRDLDEAHALINGKWLIGHMAHSLTKRDRALCRYEWLAHARSVGGLAEICDWWQRVTGNPP